MTPFEYVTVLISIILGLGVTQIVTGIADIVHRWERVRLYWPHMLWILFAFFLHVQEWWSIYDLRHFESWKLSTFLFVTLYPINLFILARILFPFGTEQSETDFKVFYYDNNRKFFIWVIVLIILSTLENVFVHGYLLTQQPVQLALMATLSVLTYKNYKAEWVHQALVIVLSLLLLITILFIEKPLI